MSNSNLEIISQPILSMSNRRKPTINNVITSFYDETRNVIIIIWFNDRTNKNAERKVKVGTPAFKRYVREGVIDAGTAQDVGFRLYESGLVVNVRRRQYRRNVKLLKKEIISWLQNNMSYDLEIQFNNYENGYNQVIDIVLEVAGASQNGIVASVGDVYYTLNDYNIARLRGAIQAQFVDENVVIGVSESDEAFENVLNNFETMTLHKPKTQTNLQNPADGFFRHYHKTDMDLDYLGIFNQHISAEVHSNMLNINCVIRALKEGGMKEVDLTKLRTIVVNRVIPMCKFKEICGILKCAIIIKRLKLNPDDDGIYRPTGSINRYGMEFQEEGMTYNLGSINQHIFIRRKHPITAYALKHYFELKNLPNFHKIINNKNKLSNTRFMDTFDMIKYMFNNQEKYLKPVDMASMLKTQFYDTHLNDELFDLEYDEDNDTELNVWDAEKEAWKLKTFKKPIVFFDFETDTSEEVHKPYLVCSIDENGNKRKFINSYDATGKCRYDCGKRFLQSLTKDTLLIAHNAGYDYQFICKYLYQIDQKTKGSGLMNATAKYYNHLTKKMISIEVKDSYKLITMPLRNFGKCFKLTQDKEVMPYGLYTANNIKKNWLPLQSAIPFIKEDEYDKLVDNCKKWKCIQTINGVKHFDIMRYSIEYCYLDCIILQKGYSIFRGWILEALGLDINNVWTIASLADKYLLKEGVYDNVYKLAGIPRLFIQKCVVGGRTMCVENKMVKLTEEKNGRVADYDGVSLYPSSFQRMGMAGGVLQGTPKILQDDELNMAFLNSIDGYFVKVKVLSLGIKRQFPLASIINKQGVRVFRNDIVGKTFHMDKYALEDLMNFQDVKVEIIRGYYYNEGRNPKIKKVIEFLFNERLKKKAEKNPIQLVYKLVMNASYGRSILKPITTNEKVVDTTKDKDLFIQKNYNKVICCNPMYGCDKWRIKLINPISNHFNNCVLGVECLSMSKRIMNEVMCLAEDNGLQIYYQDTDSIHINYDDVAVLISEYKNKYNRDLDGKQLGQFHIDFDLKDDDGNDCKDVYAEKSIFLGKKCYIDCLVGYKWNKTDDCYCLDADGNKIEIRGNHLRMKGVPNSTIGYTSNKLDLTEYQLYKQLYDSEDAVKFDLLNGGARCNFKFNKNMSVQSLTEFERKLKFNGEKYYQD